jgi:hypothetical protein
MRRNNVCYAINKIVSFVISAMEPRIDGCFNIDFSTLADDKGQFR